MLLQEMGVLAKEGRQISHGGVHLFGSKPTCMNTAPTPPRNPPTNKPVSANKPLSHPRTSDHGRARPVLNPSLVLTTSWYLSRKLRQWFTPLYVAGCFPY